MRTDKEWFVDKSGRKVLLRGVNLGGSTKMPIDEPTHIRTDFSNHRDVSFVGRPFSVESADMHFKRLKHWGFNTLRLLTTWEAIEHKGPGKYDKEYLDYFTKIVEMAGKHDFYVFIDPHQDVWSRMTGGDGAPGWTLEKLGMDISKLSPTDSALTMQYHYPDNYPQMRWAFNYFRYAAATMFTLFFAGNEFAPNTKIDNIPVQDYLQSHFINSMSEIAKHLADMDHVIGFGPLNEPGRGYVGVKNLHNRWEAPILGPAPTPFDTMIAAGGYSVDVPYYDVKWLGIRKTREYTMNPDELSIWNEGSEPIWKREDIWNDESGIPELSVPDHFNTSGGFFKDYLRPFSIDYINSIRKHKSDALVFIENEPINSDELYWGEEDPKGVVNASHWYDAATLVTKKYRSFVTLDVEEEKLVFRSKNVKNLFTKQLASIRDTSKSMDGGIPTLIGEFGVPYDMHSKKAYRTGNYSKQIEALSLYYDIQDELMLNSTLWNYTADNSNEWGDLWNMEDLSIFSPDQQNNPDDINSGGRAITGFCRPYPMKVSGTPISYKFYRKTGIFQFSYENDPSIEMDTVVYIPKIQYPDGLEFNIVNADWSIQDQFMTINSDAKITVHLGIKRK